MQKAGSFQFLSRAATVDFKQEYGTTPAFKEPTLSLQL